MATAAHIEIGRIGETLAAAHLERLGYELVERNFRTREGEIDLIASGAGALVFCEVKTLVVRAHGHGPTDPLESVHPAKRAQVRRMAAAWLAQHNRVRHQPELRFDAIGVSLSPARELLRLNHVENAF